MGGRRVNPLQHIIDGLVAERYAPSVWWTRDQIDPVLDDSDIATARRRRLMAEDFARTGSEVRSHAS